MIAVVAIVIIAIKIMLNKYVFLANQVGSNHHVPLNQLGRENISKEKHVQKLWWSWLGQPTQPSEIRVLISQTLRETYDFHKPLIIFGPWKT